MNKEMFGRATGAVPLAPTGSSFDDFALDLRALWSTIYRNRHVVSGIIFIAVLIGLVVTMLTTPKYTARTSVQIEEQSTRVLQSQDDTEDRPGPTDEERFLQTQDDVLQSRAIRQLVIDKLNLARGDSFFGRMRVKPPAGTIGSLDADASRREAVIDLLGKDLNIVLTRNSRIVGIEFTSPDPALAAQISTAVAQTYITFNLQRKFDTSAYARNFIEQRLAEVKRRLEDSERALIDYARGARLIDASSGSDPTTGQGGPRSLTAATLVQINGAYASATAQRLAAQQRWDQARLTPLMSLPDVVSNGTVQALAQRRAEAQAAYDQDRARRKPDFPSMQQAMALINELDNQITSAAEGIRSVYKDQFETALKQERALAARLEDLKRDTLSEQDRSVRYTILRRESDTNRTLYDGLLQRYKELSASAGLLSNNISIVDQAPTPIVPVSPRLWLNLVLALIAGSVLAGALVLVREKLEDVIRLPEDVGRKLHLAHLNSIPLLPSSVSPTDALSDPRSPFSEAYYALRTSIELASPDGPPKLLLFTSTRQGEGKSTSAAAVAQNFARTGKRVLLIDGDLRKPSLHRLLGVPRGIGFANLLSRLCKVDDVIVHMDELGIDFIPCGPPPPNPADLLSGATLVEVLREVRSRYDHVIIDGPPVLGLADAVLLANVTDAVVFIVQFNSSKGGQVRAALARLQDVGAEVLGAVMTKFDARKTGYGDEYGYIYTYGADQPVSA